MDRGRSFIHLRSLEARTIQDRLLSEEVEWNGSDYPLASALTLLTSPTLCLLRFLIHHVYFYLYDTDIAIDLSLGPANRIVKYVFSLSRNQYQMPN
jgi:hypothetical protein